MTVPQPPRVAAPGFDDWLWRFWKSVSPTSEQSTTDHASLSNLNSGSYSHLTATQKTSLTGSGNSTIHYHLSDRDRANHTGTQPASTISDLSSVVQAFVGTHSNLLNIEWTVSGHTGTALTIPGFAATTGIAEELTRSGTGTVVAMATSPTFTTPTINTAASIGGTWTAAAAWTIPAVTLGGTVTSNGQSFSGTIANLGTITTADINGGTIDGTTIGGASAAAGTFTDLTSTGNTTLGNASTDTLDVGNGGIIKDASGNVGIGTSTFGTSAVTVLSIATGTAPTTGPADTVQFYSSDDAAGHTIPSFFCEGTNVVATGQADSASSVRIKVRINGTVYTLLAI